MSRNLSEDETCLILCYDQRGYLGTTQCVADELSFWLEGYVNNMRLFGTTVEFVDSYYLLTPVNNRIPEKTVRVLIVRGEVVIPRPEEVVTKWRV